MKKQIRAIILLMVTSSLYASQPTLKKAIPTTTTSNVGQMPQYIKPGTYYNPTINAPLVPTYGSSVFANKPNIVNAAVVQRNISNIAAGSTKTAKINYYKPIEKGSYQRLSWWNNAWNYMAQQWNQIFNKKAILEENKKVFFDIMDAVKKPGPQARDEVRDILDMHPNFPIDGLYSKKNVRLVDMLVVDAAKRPDLLPILKFIITRRGASVNGRITVAEQQQLTPLGTVLVLLATGNKQAYRGARQVFDLLLENGARTDELVIIGREELSIVQFAQVLKLPTDIIEELKKERTFTAPTSKSFNKFLDTFDPRTKTYGKITITKKIKKNEEKPSPKDQYAQLDEQRAQEIFNELEKAIMTNDLDKVKDILTYAPGFKINKSYQADTVGHKIRLIDLAAFKAIEDYDKMPDGLSMIKLLIKNGVDLNAHFKTEETAFLKLCLQGIKHNKPGAKKVLGFFIESGIHVDTPMSTRHGKITPLEYARKNHFSDDVINMLIEAGAKK